MTTSARAVQWQILKAFSRGLPPDEITLDQDSEVAENVELVLNHLPWWRVAYPLLREIYFDARYLTSESLHYYLPALLCAATDAYAVELRRTLGFLFSRELSSRNAGVFGTLAPLELSAVAEFVRYVNEREQNPDLRTLYKKMPELPCTLTSKL